MKFVITTDVHAKCCGPCPSARDLHSPEVGDIMGWPREEQTTTIFNCAWRPEKLCRGYVDLLSVTPDEIANVIRQRMTEVE